MIIIEHEGHRITFAAVETIHCKVVENPILGYRLSLIVEGYIQAASQEEAEQSLTRILAKAEE